MKDSFIVWVPLSQLKIYDPVQVMLFAKPRGLQVEPAFKW